MSVKERIKKFIKNQNITISSFEKSLNVANGYVNSISNNLGIDKINMLLELYPNINLEWLFTGKGKMLKKEEEKEVVISNNSEVEPLKKHLEDKDKLIKMLEKEVNRLEDEVMFLKKNRPPVKYNIAAEP